MASVTTPEDARKARIEGLVRDHHAFVWRSARHLGVRGADLDDVVQEVFVVVARHLDTLERERERGFLFQTCVFVAAHSRRSIQRRREVADDEHLEQEIDLGSSPEQDAVDAQARVLLQRIVDAMPDDNRIVFVLFEIEQMTMAEVARTLDVPPGTVASRLRRAREILRTHPLARALMGASDE